MSVDSRAARPSLSASLSIFIACTSLLAIAGLAGSWWFVGPPQDVTAVVVLTTLGLLSEIVKEKDVGGRVGFSNMSIILLASIPLVGPIGAAVIGGVTLAIVPPRVALIRRYFNTMMHIVLGTLGGSIYVAAGGKTDLASIHGVAALLGHVALPLLLADVAQMICNAALVAGVLRSERGLPFRVTFTGMVGTSGLAYLGYGVVGFLLVVLWVPAGVGVFSAFLILAPLSVARWAIVQYGDEVRSHESALSALVTAVETKDPRSTGHSSRVAVLTGWMVEPLGLSAAEASALRFAAMLHDVGKISLPTQVVRHVGALEVGDLALLSEHPTRAVDFLQEMTFLEPSLEGIRHHHERWDGRGYPDGLQGDEIPLISRIIAVADALDSLTMVRAQQSNPSADVAMSQIAARAGSQFDPAVVEALGRVLERNVWIPGEVGTHDLQRSEVDSFDHDNPQASDLYAQRISDVCAGTEAPVEARP